MAEAGQDEARPDANAAENPPARGKGRLMLILGAGGLVLMLAAGAGAYVFVPQVGETVQSLMGKKPKPEQTANSGPSFVDLPEMVVTVPNNGHARQLRIKMSLELAKRPEDFPATQILSPRVYDALLTYLRTLREGELDSGLALDRMRSDLYRRITLVIGPGVVSDVLITGLVLG